MLRNYLKIAWRNLRRDRQFTMLNVVGLSTGLACTLMIWLWVADERHMDKYNETDERLYQVMQNIPHEGTIETAEYTPGLLADAMAAELPEVENAASVVPPSWFSSKGIIANETARLRAKGQFVSPGFFDLFSCPILTGNAGALTSDKQSIAISDELAFKLFHTTEGLIGKTLAWNQNEFNGNYHIAAIFRQSPANCSEPYDILFNFSLFVEKRPSMKEWGNSDPHTYLLLKTGTDIGRFNGKIRDFIQSKEADSPKTLFVRRFSDKYLFGKYANGVQSGGRITYVRLFSLIAIFILVIACINFMNLSTAKASRRIKEAGVQKVLGARRRNLVLQYLGESTILSLVSLVLSLVLMVALLPGFNQITGKSLQLSLSSRFVATLAIATLLTGLLAGSYPALYISGFRPAAVLKGKLVSSGGELWIRKGLVVFQFVLSVVGIASVMVIYQQMHYIQSRDLGYDRDHVVDFSIPLESDSAQMSAAETFLYELKNMPGVVNASSYYHNLTGDHGGIGGFQWPGKDPSADIDFANLEVGSGFLETMGIQLVEGRYFSPDQNASKEIIFNQTAIRQMGLKDPIGKTIKYWDRERVIVGVARDFNFESLYETVKPCFFQIYPIMPNIIVRIKAGTEQPTIARIKQAYNRFNDGLTFDYRFLDDDYQAMYTAENRVAALSRYFAGLAILISCLGLFGLAAFSAQRRQKEIGIRKVIGASTSRIAFLLSRDFFKLVFIALLIGLPLIAWLMSDWLDSFAYRIHLGPSIFFVSAGLVLVVTLLSISFQAIRAAVANPVKSLRTE